MPEARINKADLLELIEEGYKAGYGPRHIAKITGYSREAIMRYAKSLGLKSTTTRPKIPENAPVEFLIGVQKCGLVK